MWRKYNLPKISNARRERTITKRTKGVRAKYFSSFIASRDAQQRRNFNKTSGQRYTYITCIYECVWALIARTLKGISLRVTVGKCGGAEKTPSRPRGNVFRRIIFTSFFVLCQLLRRRNVYEIMYRRHRPVRRKTDEAWDELPCAYVIISVIVIKRSRRAHPLYLKTAGAEINVIKCLHETKGAENDFLIRTRITGGREKLRQPNELSSCAWFRLSFGTLVRFKCSTKRAREFTIVHFGGSC